MLSNHLVPAALFFCLQFFPALGGQSIGASASVVSMNIQGWFPCSPRDSQESSPAPQFESINSSGLSLLYGPILTSICDYWKNHSFDYRDIVGKVMSLLFKMLSSFVITFLPRSKCLLIPWLQSPSAVILEPPKQSLSLLPLFPHLFAMKSHGTGCHDLSFLKVEF